MTKLNKRQLRKLREKLPRGFAKVLIESYGATVGEQQIRNVAEGSSQNTAVLDLLIKYVNDLREEEKAIALRIKEAVS